MDTLIDYNDTEDLVRLEMGDMRLPEMVEFVQRLIDSGAIQDMRHSLRALAQDLINQGHCSHRRNQ